MASRASLSYETAAVSEPQAKGELKARATGRFYSEEDKGFVGLYLSATRHWISTIKLAMYY